MTLAAEAPSSVVPASVARVAAAQAAARAAQANAGRGPAAIFANLSRSRRQFVLRFLLPLALNLGYLAVVLGLTFFAAHQAAGAAATNSQHTASYQARVSTWFGEVRLAQRPLAATVVAVNQGLDGLTHVSLQADGVAPLTVSASTACLPKDQLAVGTPATVFIVPGVDGVPAMFNQTKECADPALATAAPGSDYAAPTAPVLVSVQGYLMVECAAMLGITLMALGFRRMIMMRRYGIGTAINAKRGARRRNMMPYFGGVILLGAIVAYPMVDTLAVSVRHFFAAHGL